MTISILDSWAKRVGTAAIMSLSLTACAGNDRDPTDGIHDPYETRNRALHGFNKGLDTAIVRPVARGYSAVLPDPIEDSVSNFAENFGQPANVVNSLLQADFRGAGISFSRFFFNSTIGIGGLLDPATEMAIPEHDTDFGETLYVWGVGEGAYAEAPLLGPTTTRRSVGRIVDLFTNPLGDALPEPERYSGTLANVGARLTDRSRFSNTIDSVLYDSADSYSQSRLIYLQSRRFELGDRSDDSSLDPYSDPYGDPYEDPYAE